MSEETRTVDLLFADQWRCERDEARRNLANAEADIRHLAKICRQHYGEILLLKQAIQTVLADAESQHPGGWGPDITMVAVLRKALDG